MITAQAEDGRKVILYEDVRWEYVQENDFKSINKQEYDFRRINLGASKKQVKASETEELLTEENTDYLEYRGNVAGMEARIAYHFQLNRLSGATIKLEEGKNVDRNTYLTEFYSLKAALNKKYGKSTEDNMLWRNNHYKNSPADLGLALMSGHVAIHSHWATDAMTIMLLIDGKNNKIDFVIEYIGEVAAYLVDNKDSILQIMQDL
ncbi:MAG: hypothetical protein J0665_12070 [Deltaproteobacteria bacterium]|nr:hypothetical protein [Deltaproteobacteria bacterium]